VATLEHGPYGVAPARDVRGSCGWQYVEVTQTDGTDRIEVGDLYGDCTSPGLAAPWPTSKDMRPSTKRELDAYVAVKLAE
jgi:hypothetical protein